MSLEQLKKEFRQAVHEVKPLEWWLDSYWPRLEKFIKASYDRGYVARGVVEAKIKKGILIKPEKGKE